MLHVIRELLQRIMNDIDTGNSNMSEQDQEKVIKALRKYTRKDGNWSKYQAYTFLNMSRSNFDRLVREGKIPRGRKIIGYSTLFWREKDIRKLAKNK